MSSVDAVGAALGLQHAKAVSDVQLAVAAKMLEVSNDQSDAALKLIESAAESMEAAVEAVVGQLVDFRA